MTCILIWSLYTFRYVYCTPSQRETEGSSYIYIYPPAHIYIYVHTHTHTLTRESLRWYQHVAHMQVYAVRASAVCALRAFKPIRNCA